MNIIPEGCKDVSQMEMINGDREIMLAFIL